METTQTHVDIALVGGGIMSATLGTLMHMVRPDATIAVFERLDAVALESSDPWNNAGTGHAAFCELHYTPEKGNGEIDVSKALLVNDQFHLSLQMYSWLVEQGIVKDPATFVNPIPHVGIAWGEGDVDFLRRRHDALGRFPQFSATEFSDRSDTLTEWLPLVMHQRRSREPIAATRYQVGTDVNYGTLSRQLFSALERGGTTVHTGTEITSISRDPGGPWTLMAHNRNSGTRRKVNADFVFVGAGGTALHLLQKSGIREIKGIGGFPVSGQFLRCTNPDLIALHNAKVYGRPATGAPPMTAPHLDTRVMEGKRGLMFGPFAGFTPRFLKRGSMLDFARSIKVDNILTMLSVARTELPLTAYLIRQVLQSMSDRVDHLRGFVPSAIEQDWELIQAGQRVQVMRPVPGKRGVLQFGTEVITANDGTIAGLLGASPGASTATAIMLNVMERCFPADFKAWQPKLREVIPSLGIDLVDNPVLLRDLDARANRSLKLVR